ncbi:MAG: hypothetical protein PWQ22_673 [Archaeoglobaceae archaeon]|nr:hypothetical protein [Archaeoglobaceae archaeon]MDK2876263.1 hypothetical protein [Archaeoglobaceae archaeon]
MPKVKLLMPADSTFLSSVIYEGLLYLIHKDHAQRFDLREIDFKPNFLSKAYSELEYEKIENVRIAMAGNDNLNSKLFEKLGSNLKSRKTFYDLIKMLKDNSGIIREKELVELQFRIFGKDNLLDLKRKSEGIAAPQLFKIDRYTGFSSLETPYTSKQLTFYISPEVALISLLGIYSSFILNVRQQDQNYNYFLFFSPDEVLKLLVEGSKDLVDRYFKLKKIATDELRKIIEKYPLNELMAIELATNLEIRRLMDSENLDKFSLFLFKIAPEGQTYKIYETIPLEIYESISFYEIAGKYFKDADKFIENLSDALSPDKILMEALSSLNKRNRYSEAENVLSAVQSLYRFVMLGDAQGFFGFLRGLEEARRKLENSKDKRETHRAGRYRRILARF